MPQPTIEPRDRRGVVLLEVLVALTILAAAGLSLVSLLRQSLVTQAAAIALERQMDEADRVLSATSLLSAPELEQRLGVHVVAGFAVEIQRPERRLFRIALADSAVPGRELLVTVVYRAGEARP